MKFCRSWLSILFLGLALAGCDDSAPTSSGSAPQPHSEATPDASTIELVFTYGSEKENWLEAVTKNFNSSGRKIADGRKIVVRSIPMGSGECVEEILKGTRVVHLTSPASSAYIELGNSESMAKLGKPLVGKTESIVFSPVVIAMWKPMAEALGWPERSLGWSDILSMANEPAGWGAKGHPEWGPFRFGHTHPESSNSGLMSLLAEVYAATGVQRGLTLEMVANPHVAEFLAGIERSVVHYGSSTGFFGKKMFANGPQYLSAAVLYENMVIESYSKQLPFPVVAIYPKEGTFWSDHPMGVVDRPEVTEAHKEAAKIYMAYLLEDAQQAETLKYGFRPASVNVPLGAPTDAAHGVDPKEPQTTLEVPSVAVMDAILRLWREHKKHSSVILTLDISGSMNEENGARIRNAKEGAAALVSVLHPKDRFGMLVFNQTVAPLIPSEPLGESLPRVQSKIQGIFAQGGTALYDAIAIAYDRALEEQKKQPNFIHAIVVLTDGLDTNSTTSLDQLIEKVRYDNESKTVRIFTIGYGSGASKEVLEKIANATQAKHFEGTPENIQKVFREIAMFF